MKSLKELLILGPGPSSSHTIGPYRIVNDFLKRTSKMKVESYSILVCGSLALTGKGHFTDLIIKKALEGKKYSLSFSSSFSNLKHPNTMKLTANLKDNSIYSLTYFSIGGGSFRVDGEENNINDLYPFSSFDELKKYMETNNIYDIYQIIEHFEGEEIYKYGLSLLKSMFNTIKSELKEDFYLPGPLKLETVSMKIYKNALLLKNKDEKRTMLLTAFSYATSEANAMGKIVCTTPTCGASGVVPAVLYYEKVFHHYSYKELVKAFLVGALVCNFIKENAAVSGALLGCQAEIGSASCFASASLCYLHHLSLRQIEYGAEVAMEHFLGLTCDPVNGYVQIPCIERNGMASIHSYTSYLYSKDIAPFRSNKVSFDNVIKAMKETGEKMDQDLKETSLGGLAKIVHFSC